MAYTVPYAFDQFFDSINLPGDHRRTANERRDRIATYLDDEFALLEVFPSGSIPRYTALRGRSDLDIIVVLHYGRHVKGKAPSQVLKAVRDALARYGQTRVRRNGQAVTLGFTTWPAVDIVPAKRYGNDGVVTGYAIPDMHTEEWIDTRPRDHTKRLAGAASAQGAGFKRMIKMIKEWNHAHSAFFQSFHLEVLALRALATWGFDDDDDHTWPLFQFFENAVPLVEEYLWYDTGFADDYLDWKTRTEGVNRMKAAAKLAGDAWWLTYNGRDRHQEAILLWRRIFGDRFPAYG